LRVAFAGTPGFAARALEAIIAAGHEVPLVLTRPDRPAGRGMRPAPSVVGESAVRHGCTVLKPASLRSPEVAAALRDAGSEVMVVAAYGMILPEEVLAIPGHGCINIHASLLPRWRGAAPIQRAILAGDASTGISIMQMDAGLDTGPVLLRREVPIGPRDTAGTLTETLARLGAHAVIEVLGGLASYRAQAQDESLATHAPKVAKSEAIIDWMLSSEQIGRCVRAFNPAPGAQSNLQGQAIKIWEARPDSGSGQPGEVLATGELGLLVACGRGALWLTAVQRAGSRRLNSAEFLRGFPIREGARFESPEAASS
jgi:methionyl-tRNA formyltransferase